MDWQPLYHGAVYATALLLAVALLLTARRIAVGDKARSLPVLLLRMIVLAGLITLLLNPIDRRKTVLPPRPPSVALVVDCSQSMTLGQGESRLQQVVRTIARASRQIDSNSRRIQLFRFGQRLAKVPSLAEFNADEGSSLLASAMERLPSRLAGDTPQAVVVFSDGAVEAGPRLAKVTAAYRELGIPVYGFLPARESLRGDVAITELVLPERVTEGDTAIVRGEVRSRGFDGQRVVVSVVPKGPSQSPPLATLPITLIEGATAFELPLVADPGDGELMLTVPVSDGEAVASNNRIPFQLPRRDRELDVLYMEGTAGSEYHWLRDALEEDVDIRCLPMVVNNQYASRPTLQRVDDPYRGFPSTRQELFEYDVVICSDIPRGAFTPEQIDWTVELVDRRGGGFAMVGGHTSFGSGGWDRTPWEKLIPFDMTGRRDYLAQTFNVDVPVDVQSHPIWKLLDDPQQNRRALDAMPHFTGTNLIRRVKPAATLLGQTASPLSRVGVMPVFACESYGRGRTFAMSTDTTLSWGRIFESQWGEGDNRYYRKFWRNVVRWLAENSLASQKRLIVRTDKIVYSSDDPIRFTAEAFDDQLRPTTDYQITARLRAVDQAGTTVESDESIGNETGAEPTREKYTGELTASLGGADDPSQPMQPARLIVTATDAKGNLMAEESLDLQLLHDSSEWLDPQSRPDILAQLASAGGGSVLENERQLSDLIASFKPPPGEELVHTLPLWDRPWIWLAFVGLLAAEWSLRRRGTGDASGSDAGD